MGRGDGARRTTSLATVAARLAGGLGTVASSAAQAFKDGWFGPGQPIPPSAPPDVKGRVMDYMPGLNLYIAQERDSGIGFDDLRALAENWDLLRIIMESRKDEVCKLKWTVRPVEQRGKAPQARIDAILSALRKPDRVHWWQQWLRMLLEDLFVLDAPCVYVRPTRGGGVYSLDVLDGATIKRLLDYSGRTPTAPVPAYQQILKGLPAAEYTTEELLYAPRNVRSHRVYGFSPVEQIIMTVNIGLRREISQLEWFTAGNMPETLVPVAPSWTPSQINDFQSVWDGLMEGNLKERRKAKFIPGGGGVPQSVKTAPLKDDFDEWLARVACFAFGVSPQPFIKMVNRATAKSAEDKAKSEGLESITEWITDFMTSIIQGPLGAPDLCFDFQEERESDPLLQAQASKIYVEIGAITVDDVREDLGKDPYGVGPYFATAAGPVPLFEVLKPTQVADGELGFSQAHFDAVEAGQKQAASQSQGAQGAAEGGSGGEPSADGSAGQPGAAPQGSGENVEKARARTKKVIAY